MKSTIKLTDVIQIGTSALSIPILFLNTLGGVVSGIWLATLGDWEIIINGVLYMVISGILIFIALMPAAIIILPAVNLVAKGKLALASFFGFLSNLYTTIILVLWCLWILHSFTITTDTVSLIPILIWSYCVAMAPWISFARQEGPNVDYASRLTLFFAELAYIAVMIMSFFQISFLNIIIAFSAIMGVCVLVETAIFFLLHREMYKSEKVINKSCI